MIRHVLFFAALFACLTVPQARAQQPAPKAPAEKLDGPPLVTAKAWVIADGKTGKVLWGAKEAEPLAMASTTKIMTAWIVCELAAKDPKVLDEVIVVSERAAKTTGSGAKIKAGEKFAVRDMLYGLLLPSGNDASVALAEHFGPRFRGDAPANADAVALFVAEMNRQAQAQKLAELKYFDPHGLGKNHTSARNLAALAAKALQNPLFAKYVQVRRHECEAVGPNDEKRAVVWSNTNKLLGIEGYDGVKTGTTGAAGSCLVGSGRRGTDHLIVIVLGATSDEGRYLDTRNLFRWAWRERSQKTSDSKSGEK